jgi:hypothetical protein
MRARFLPVAAILLMAAGGVAAVTASARTGPAASARSAAAEPNDGLPKQWFGVTRWVEPPRYSTLARVVFTLTKKAVYHVPPEPRSYYIGSTGTAYTYGVSEGSITMTGLCSYGVDTKGALRPGNGFLVIEVAGSPGTTPRAIYDGNDTATLAMGVNHCPNGATPAYEYWGFRTTSPDYHPILRPLSTVATKIEGKLVENDAFGKGTYEWCFVRSRTDLPMCGHVASGKPGQ